MTEDIQLYPAAPTVLQYAENMDRADSTGFKKFDAKKPRADLLPAGCLMEVAEVMKFGAEKYGDHNWRHGTSRGRFVGAALRHVFAWMRGEDIDPESGLPHLAHAICSLMMLRESEIEGYGHDSRWGAE